MQLVLAQTFKKRVQQLRKEDRRLVSDEVLLLQLDPEAPSHNLHRVEGAKDWWTCYVNGDWRIILARQGEAMVLCWTDHHDDAYLWAKRHVLERHPITGGMQLVEIPEAVAPPPAAPAPARPKRPPKPLCEALGLGRDDLLALGIPERWVERVLGETDPDRLLDLGQNHLPPDAAEAVLRIAVGEKPEPPEEEPAPEQEKPFESARDRQSWWVATDDDSLRAALEVGWDEWTVFLHPVQRAVAYRSWSGPARVAGTAGTGKTVVLLHHARHLLERDPAARVLVTTFSENLADDLNWRKGRLLKPRQQERCETLAMREFGRDCLNKRFPGHPYLAERWDLRALVREVLDANAAELPSGISPAFALSEWERIVDARDLRTWESYRDAVRRGVRKRLAEPRRAQMWAVFEKVRGAIREKGWMTEGEMFGALREWYATHDEGRFYTHVLVDESQDLCEVELTFLAAYAGTGPDALFFAGDIGQRVVRNAFKWSDYGVSVRGRSRILKVNYRTTKEIRGAADRLMDEEGTDPDGNVQDRRGTVSLLSGPAPEFRRFADKDAEIEGVAEWLRLLAEEKGVKAGEVAVFFRSENERDRAKSAIARSPFAKALPPPKLCPRWDAKGLEYRAVVVMACDSDVIPSPERIAEADLVTGLGEIYETERNLLYVACTRARDYLLVTCAGVPSEFLLDLNPAT